MGDLYQLRDAQTIREFESAVGAMDLASCIRIFEENPGLQEKMLDMVENGKIREFKPRTPPEVA
jgi:hypothetical protein